MGLLPLPPVRTFHGLLEVVRVVLEREGGFREAQSRLDDVVDLCSRLPIRFTARLPFRRLLLQPCTVLPLQLGDTTMRGYLTLLLAHW